MVKAASTPGGAEDRKRSHGVWIAFGALLFYLLFPTRQFYWDGVGFAASIEASRGSIAALLHPNHLIYNLAGYVVWRLLALCGIQVRALFVLQAENALFAAGTVLQVHDIFHAMTHSTRRSAFAALLFAFAATWWKFAGDANAYVPSLFFLVLTFRLILPRERRSPVVAALAYAAALMFHELALLFLPAAAIAFIRRTGDGDGTSRGKSNRRDLATFTVISLGLCSGAYVTGYAMPRAGSGLHGFWDWITAHAQDAVFGFPPPHALELSIRGTLRMFFGGRANGAIPGWVTIAGTVMFAVIIVLLLYSLALSCRRLRVAVLRDAAVSLREWFRENPALAAWILTYVVFLFFWQPQNVFYRLFYLPPLILLTAAAPAWRDGRGRVLGLLAAAAFVWNFTVSVYPHSRAQSNEVLVFAQEHQRELDQGAVVVYSNFHTDLWLISYFNPRGVWVAEPSPEIAHIESRCAEATQKGLSLWLEGRVYDAIDAQPEGREWLRRHIDVRRSLLHSTPAHTIRFYRLR